MDFKTISLTACLIALPAVCRAQSPVFPYGVPKDKPDMPLSKAMERAYTDYSSLTTWGNELFTKFRHTELEGLEYNGGDGTLSRRDPSKVVKAKGKYYLYYQAFLEMSGTRGDDCPVTVSWSDSPDGPWTPVGKIVVPNGPSGTWDQYSIHDPCPLVYKGKIYLYYKSESNGRPRPVRFLGVAIADDPLGPFEKHALNPVLNSGHETGLFPFKEGIAALVIRHGNEHNTIQYAPDGVNFDVASSVSLMPIAAGPYVPDAFTNSGYGRGITWGLSHFTTAGTKETKHSILSRFDCDLSLDVDDVWMKEPEHWWPPEFYFHSRVNATRRKQLEREAREDLHDEAHGKSD